MKVSNDAWCNGNTADFGSVIRGSNPLASTTCGYHLVGQDIRFSFLVQEFESPYPYNKLQRLLAY